MPELGVGLVYWPALAPLFDAADVVDVLELEPQSLWEKLSTGAGWRYVQNDAAFERVVAYPHAKLVHGVGHPVGGSVEDPIEHAGLLRSTVDALRPAWASEHLSFNRVRTPHGSEETGFLLPVRQSPGGVRVAASNVASFRRAAGCPVAFETGTNYLRRRVDEIADGEFFAAVADQSDCAILLDLHNLWCNELNGRGAVLEVVDALPPERVWEVHVAGGMDLDGYRLDAHSGRVHPDLIDLAADVISRLPNLGALTFEILPEHVPSVGLDGIHRQLDELRALWSAKPARRFVVHGAGSGSATGVPPEDVIDVATWEGGLTAAIAGRPFGSFADLAQDPGVRVYRELVRDFRRGAAARCLRHTTTALLLGLGRAATYDLLDRHFAECAPDGFATVEAERIARYLDARRDVTAKIPHFDEVLAFEHTLLRAALFGEPGEVEWTADPTAVIDALQEGRLPAGLPRVLSRMRVEPTSATKV